MFRLSLAFESGQQEDMLLPKVHPAWLLVNKSAPDRQRLREPAKLPAQPCQIAPGGDVVRVDVDRFAVRGLRLPNLVRLVMSASQFHEWLSQISADADCGLPYRDRLAPLSPFAQHPREADQGH